MKRIFRFLLFLVATFAVLYLLGPKPDKPLLTNDLPTIPSELHLIEKMVLERESNFNVRPDNQARFLWAADSLPERTDWSMLYLHGFSASWFEGYPVHYTFAQTFGMNAYFPRLAGHGLQNNEPLIDMTPDALWESAKEALLIARKMGKKVVVMGTSTGATLGLKLAAEFPEYVDALILYSPNIKINNPAAFLLTKPWGLQIARQVYKSRYRVVNEEFDSQECQYWYCSYRLEGVVYLQQLVENTMQKSLFEKIETPLFLGYFYKNQEEQDQVVKIDAALDMFRSLGTPSDFKREVAFPDAGDHVITSEILSGSVNEVTAATLLFGNEILNLHEYK